MKHARKILVAGLIACSSMANAQPVASLGAGNVGITGFDYGVTGNTITLFEFWGASGPGSIAISGLESNVNYTIVKKIFNQTGIGWTSFANELLSPGNAVPGQPGFVPVGFRTSDENDGLSFAQGSGLPRTSTVFSSVFADEFAGRDYIDFATGTLVADGEMTFGIRNAFTANQPFLLFQRPDEFTGVVPVPAALPLLLSGLGIFGFLARRRIKA